MKRGRSADAQEEPGAAQRNHTAITTEQSLDASGTEEVNINVTDNFVVGPVSDITPLQMLAVCCSFDDSNFHSVTQLGSRMSPNMIVAKLTLRYI